MKKHAHFFAYTVLALISILGAACSAVQSTAQPASNAPAAGQVAAQETFTDPFLYCTTAGTIDKPDSRYTGEKVPDAIIKGYISAAGLNGTTEPLDVFKKSTIWRCMDKKVYVCNFGANLPCDSKANTSKTPTQAMADFCKENQSSDFIPMAVTGHDTIYAWRCVNGAAQVGDQLDKADAAGFLERIWYKIEPGS